MLQRAQDLKISTAEFKKVPSPTNGNGQARNSGNGHRRRVRHQIHNGYRRSALKADTAIMLVESGMEVTKAIERCSTGSNAFYAMKAVKESGDAALYDAVSEGDEPLLAAGLRVKNAAAAITAFKKCSGLERELFRLATGATDDPVTMLLNLKPDQVVATSKALGLDWVWDKMIAAAMETKKTTTETTEAPEVFIEEAETAASYKAFLETPE
jgi:hypothetical protein